MKKTLVALVVTLAMVFMTAGAFATHESPVKPVVANYYDEYIKDLGYLVSIDSGTGNLDGSKKIAAYLQEKLEAQGATVEFRDNDQGRHVIARIKGEGNLRVLLSPHTDTVFDPGEAAKRPFTIEGNKGYGPGAGDCKGSVVQMVYMVKAMKELGVKNFGEIIIYFDAEEETGSQTEEAILEELAQQADLALIVDGSRPNWGICTQRKGSANYEIKVTGIQGHAGNAPQASASAIMELANQITLLGKLNSPLPGNPNDFTADALAAKKIKDHGQYIPDNWINVGTITSTNSRVNRVADNASAKIQLRAYKMSELQRLDQEIKALAQKNIVPGTKVTIEGGITGQPMEKTPKSAQVIDMYKNIVKREYKEEVVEWIAGGMTVGNTTAKFIPTIDALGVEADPMLEHTEKEVVFLDTFVPRTVSLIELIDELSAKWPLK